MPQRYATTVNVHDQFTDLLRRADAGSSIPAVDELLKLAARRAHEIQQRREALIVAWLAATGVPPEEAVQVERSMPDGSIEYAIRRRGPDDTWLDPD